MDRKTIKILVKIFTELCTGVASGIFLTIGLSKDVVDLLLRLGGAILYIYFAFYIHKYYVDTTTK